MQWQFFFKNALTQRAANKCSSYGYPSVQKWEGGAEDARWRSPALILQLPRSQPATQQKLPFRKTLAVLRQKEGFGGKKCHTAFWSGRNRELKGRRKKERGKNWKKEKEKEGKRGERKEKKEKRRARINQFFKTLKHLVVSFPSNQRYRLQLPSYSISLQTS